MHHASSGSCSGQRIIWHSCCTILFELHTHLCKLIVSIAVVLRSFEADCQIVWNHCYFSYIMWGQHKTAILSVLGNHERSKWVRIPEQLFAWQCQLFTKTSRSKQWYCITKHTQTLFNDITHSKHFLLRLTLLFSLIHTHTHITHTHM